MEKYQTDDDLCKPVSNLSTIQEDSYSEDATDIQDWVWFPEFIININVNSHKFAGFYCIGPVKLILNSHVLQCTISFFSKLNLLNVYT